MATLPMFVLNVIYLVHGQLQAQIKKETCGRLIVNVKFNHRLMITN